MQDVVRLGLGALGVEIDENDLTSDPAHDARTDPQRIRVIFPVSRTAPASRR
jgi:hypothetical protein